MTIWIRVDQITCVAEGPPTAWEATEHALVWLSGLDLGADLLVVSAQGPWASMNTNSFDPIGVRERRCVVWIRGPPNYATNRYDSRAFSG